MSDPNLWPDGGHIDLPVEIETPEIEAHAAGNTGIPFVWTFESGHAGPHVALTAIVHGNEPCGVIALDWLLREAVRPARGRLSLAFVNVEAYRLFDRKKPLLTRWVDEDFNRVWAEDVLDGPRDSVELRRAREIRPWLDTVDLLLDIHSMQQPAEPLMMAGPLNKGVAFARKVGVPATIVSDQGHAAGKRMRDYAGFGDPESARNALLVECGQHWEKEAGALALATALRFLHATGAVDPTFAAERLTQAPPPQRHVRVTEAVTIESDRGFTFARSFRGGEVIAEAGTLLGHDGDRAVVTPYDRCMLIMPSRRLWKGQTAVRLARLD